MAALAISLAAAAAGMVLEPAPLTMPMRVVSGVPHLEMLIARCEQSFEDYERALMATNPPEIVGVTIASALSALQGIADWPDTRIDDRRHLDDQLAASLSAAPGSDPAGPASVRLSECILRAELAERARSPAAK